MVVKVKGGYIVKSEKGKKLSRVYKTRKEAVNRLRQIEYFKHLGAKAKKKHYTRKVDRRMHDYGEIDFTAKKIRVNPRKGDLLNTVIHEEEHRKNPEATERAIRKRTKKIERDLTVGQAIKYLKLYQRRNH